MSIPKSTPTSSWITSGSLSELLPDERIVHAKSTLMFTVHSRTFRSLPKFSDKNFCRKYHWHSIFKPIFVQMFKENKKVKIYGGLFVSIPVHSRKTCIFWGYGRREAETFVFLLIIFLEHFKKYEDEIFLNNFVKRCIDSITCWTIYLVCGIFCFIYINK